MSGENSTVRQAVSAVTLLIAAVAIPFGLLTVGFGILANRTADDGPTCDGEPMTPNTECWTFESDDVGVTSYEQAVEARRKGVESGEGMLETGMVIVVIGVAAAVIFKQSNRTSSGAVSSATTPPPPIFRSVPPSPHPIARPEDPRNPEPTGQPHGFGPRPTDDPQARVPSRSELAAHAGWALQQGDLGGAAYWSQLAADAGDAQAMNNLGRLLQIRIARQNWWERWHHRHRNEGDLTEAGLWFRRAAEAGNPDAMGNLAALLHKDGQQGEAELWSRRAAAATGRPGDTAGLDRGGGGAGPAADHRYPDSAATPARPAAPIPPATVSARGSDLGELLAMVMGNHATAERLIAFEQRKDPTADRATAIGAAIDRLREDRQRQG